MAEYVTPEESPHLLDQDDHTDTLWRVERVPLPPTNHRELTVAHILHFGNVDAVLNGRLAPTLVRI